jgi:hypothetical protein
MALNNAHMSLMRNPRGISAAAALYAVAASISAPLAATAAPAESPQVVVAEAKLEARGKEVAQTSISTPLGVEAQIDFGALKDMEGSVRLSLRVDRAPFRGFVVDVSAFLDGRMIATTTRDSSGRHEGLLAWWRSGLSRMRS